LGCRLRKRRDLLAQDASSFAYMNCLVIWRLRSGTCRICLFSNISRV
jgi:hypothetical protein